MAFHQHPVRKANPNRHLPPDPPTISGGVLNPDPVRSPPPNIAPPADAVAPPAGTVRAGHPLLQDAHPAAPPPPGAYSPTDPQLFWMNNRPFLLHRSVGKGGFGEVFRAEMMLPPGMEVSRDPTTGAFILDEQGRVEVRLTRRSASLDDPLPNFPLPTENTSSSPGSAPPAGSIENIGAAPGEEVDQALELSEAVPESMNFFAVEDITENVDGKQDAGSGTLSGRDLVYALVHTLDPYAQAACVL